MQAKVFCLVLSAFCACAAVALPQLGLGFNNNGPQNNCRIEYEYVKTNSCTPRYEHICEKENVTHQEIVYKKMCMNITDITCGIELADGEGSDGGAEQNGTDVRGFIIARRRRGAEAEEGKNSTVTTKNSTVATNNSTVATKNSTAANATVDMETDAPKNATESEPQFKQAQDECRNKTREHCWSEATVQMVLEPTDKCFYMRKIDCVEVVQPVHKQVCGPPPEAQADNNPAAVPAFRNFPFQFPGFPYAPYNNLYKH